jgi:hypothetical protein
MILIKNIYVILFILAVSLFGCTKKTNVGDRIKLRGSKEPISISLDKPVLIKLQGNSIAPLASIEKIIDFKNRLYILDKIIGNSVFIYESTGRFVNHIHRVGEGPGEYKNIDNMFFDEELNHLILTPMDIGRKIHFDRDGNFLFDEFNELNIVFSDYAQTEFGEIIINKSHINGDDNLQV